MPRKATPKKKAPARKRAPSAMPRKRTAKKGGAGRSKRATVRRTAYTAKQRAPLRPVVRQQVAGRAIYRDRHGRFAKRSTWKRQGAWEEVRGKLVSTNAAHVVRHKPVPIPYHRGRPVKSITLWGHSVPPLIENNAVNRRNTFLIWRVNTYRIPIRRSGEVSDLFRVLDDKVVSEALALGFDSPQYSIQLIEADSGDVLDVNSIEFMDTDMTDEMIGDERVERAVMLIRRWIEDNFDRLTKR